MDARDQSRDELLLIPTNLFCLFASDGTGFALKRTVGTDPNILDTIHAERDRDYAMTIPCPLTLSLLDDYIGHLSGQLLCLCLLLEQRLCSIRAERIFFLFAKEGQQYKKDEDQNPYDYISQTPLI